MATRHTYAGSSQHFNGSTSGEEGREGQGGMREQMSSAGQAIQSQAQHYVEDYPISTVLAVFGIGLGVGVVLGSSMMSSRSSSSDWFSGGSSWLPSGSSSSSWFPSMSSSSSWMPSSSHSWMPSGSHSWMPSSSQSSWFGSSQPHSWGDSLMRGAKHMFGGSNY